MTRTTAKRRDDKITGARKITHNPLILEIKGNSLDDGPGIRTVIFFKGCPLSCLWCHNPESKSAGAELSFDGKECIGCGACENACTAGAIDRSKNDPINRKKCTLCFSCCKACPSKALTPVGMNMGVKEIISIVEKDTPFYETSGGGVTLSGGEPTLYMDFLSTLLRSLNLKKIHVVLETCGLFNAKKFIKIIYPYLDVIYMDLKIFDREAHERFCGVGNDLILNNFTQLNDCYRHGGIEILPRIPLIPGMTASEENLKLFANFLRQRKVKKITLLQYNPLWFDKLNKIGFANQFQKNESMNRWMNSEEIGRCKSIFDGFDIV